MKRTISPFFVSLIFLTIGVTILTGCVSNKNGEDKSVTKTDVGITGDWIIESILNQGTENPTPSQVNTTFSADSSGKDSYTVFGCAGVNDYNGTATLNENIISFSNIATTMKAGDPTAEEYERLYFNILNNASLIDFSANGNGLIIQDETGKNAILMKRLVLSDTKWILSAYNDGNSILTLPDSKLTLEFNSENGISGFTGINYLTGIYEVDYANRKLSLSNIGSTKMASPSETETVMEQKFLNLLGECTKYHSTGSVLRLMNNDGTLLLEFIKK